MILIKRFNAVAMTVALFALGGCATKQPYENLPKMDASNYEAYADIIVKNSMEHCYERVQSITQELEACTFQLTNKYFEKLYQAGKVDYRITISP